MKKAKRFLTALCSVAIATTLAVTNMGLVASAVTGGGEDKAEYKLNATVASSVVYGNEFTVAQADGFEVIVTDPSGKVVDVADGKVKASQLGNYVVTYTKDELEYTFKVNSKIDATYDLYIGEIVNGVFYSAADIPTYATTDKVYNIPSAYLGITENGVTTFVGEAIKPSFKGVEVTSEGTGYKFATAGSVFVKYEATVAGGSKVLSESKEIKVQKGFEDKNAPTISVTNFPTSGQLNSKVTLSAATVKDDYDSAVRVEISVLDPNGKAVTAATVDSETGYATSYSEDKLYFDNYSGKTFIGESSYSGMYFYPQYKGDYKVSYVAYDDAGNKSEIREYTISVSDGRAPTIKYDAATIPTNWGWNSVSNANEKLESNKITFGMPEFYDNDTAKDSITVTLTVTDPQGKTIARFDNINTNEDVTYTSTNSVFTTERKYTFSKENGFEFDIKEYVEAIKAAVKESGEAYTVTGNYTVVYSAKDATGNTASTANYYINVVEDYVDSTIPTVTIVSAPTRVVLKEGVEFTVPVANFYSKEDSNLTVTYKLVSGENEIDVTDDEVLTYKDGKLGELEIGSDLKLIATATSDAGNKNEKIAEITVVKADAKALSYDVVLVKNADADLRNGVGEINYGTIKIGNIYEEEIKNVGVELGVKDSEGAYLSEFGAEIYWADNTKIVRNITFTPSSEGTYYLEVRVFDIYGNNSVRMYPIEIGKKEDTGVWDSGASAGTLPTSADIYTTVELANSSFTLNNVGTYLDESEKENVYLATAHGISGGRFSLMGEELVMMTTGTYKVTDRPVIVTKADYTVDYVGTKDGYDAWLKSYAIEKKSIVAKQNTTITFETVGMSVPSYEEFDKEVVLPAMIAYNAVDNAKKADIKVEVSHSSGTTLKVTENEDGTYSFTPNAHGSYTVTYTAVVGGSSDSVTYTVKVGDITAPEFTVASHEKTAKVGDKFSFKVIDCTESNVTYLKTLSKDGTTLNTVRTKTGTGDNITFTSAGTYEVKYEVTDSNNNTATVVYTITVTEASNTTTSPITVLSIVLLSVAGVLIVGLVVYLIVSRKKKN